MYLKAVRPFRDKSAMKKFHSAQNYRSESSANEKTSMKKYSRVSFRFIKFRLKTTRFIQKYYLMRSLMKLIDLNPTLKANFSFYAHTYVYPIESLLIQWFFLISNSLNVYVYKYYICITTHWWTIISTEGSWGWPWPLLLLARSWTCATLCRSFSLSFANLSDFIFETILKNWPTSLICHHYFNLISNLLWHSLGVTRIGSMANII